MNNQGTYTMTCPRCGSQMNSSSRYCMKCGYLNYEHQANAQMKQYVQTKEAESYEVGGGQVITKYQKNSMISIANNTGSFFRCFATNFIIYWILMIGAFLTAYGMGATNWHSLIVSHLPVAMVITSIFFLFLYSAQLFFVKCNQRWWAALIPIYHLFILSDIAFHKKALGILFLIPGINILYLLILFYKLGKQFEYPGILTMILSVLFIPIFGFGNHLYEGHLYVGEQGNKSVERDYRLKKTFLIVIAVTFLLGTLMLLLSNTSKVQHSKQILGNTYYVYASHRIVNYTKKKIENNEVSCSFKEFAKTEGASYSFYFENASDYVFIPFELFREPIQAHVLFEVKGGVEVYSISLTDGNYGFPLTMEKDVHLSTPKDYLLIPEGEYNYRRCVFKS